jgi:hypothetical protein
LFGPGLSFWCFLCLFAARIDAFRIFLPEAANR